MNLKKKAIKNKMDCVMEGILREKFKSIGSKVLIEQVKFKSKDIKVIDDFVDQKPGRGDKLESDGEVLNGLWSGGNRIAQWKNDKIIFNDLGSKAAETVQKFIRNVAPKGWIKESVISEKPAVMDAPKLVDENDFLNDRKKVEIIKFILNNSKDISKEYKKLTGVAVKDFKSNNVNDYSGDDSLGFTADQIIEDGLEAEIIELK